MGTTPSNPSTLRLRLGIDIDGVLIEHRHWWMNHYVSQAQRHGHPPEHLAIAAQPWDYLKERCRECFDFVLSSPDIIRAHALRAGVPEALRELAEFADLWVITARPESVREATLQWMVYNGIYDAFRDVIFTQDKVSAARERGLHYHLDDAPGVLAAFARGPTQAVVYDQSYNRHVLTPLRVYSWPGFVALMRNAARVHRRLRATQT